ncbi:MAG: CoA-disulfide reductase, partial [Clostridia bacterium]|nr:CoA-disulfide reductase [Clostridia bacterium]
MSKILIVGGVAGGATAAARLRRLDESAEIIMFERTGYVSYANCGLPYYVSGVIKDKRALTLQTPESFLARFNIDVRTLSEVTAIDRAAKIVTVTRLADGTEYTENYDKLILAPGAGATDPGLPGAHSERVFTLRTVEDTFRIKKFIEKTNPKRAVVMGGGYIGIEMAENLMHIGVETTLLQRRDQILRTLDYDMACELHAHIREKGLDLRFGTNPERFYEKDGRLVADLNTGEQLICDMAILAVGVRPDTKLAKDAGLELGGKDSIVTDTHMRTSDPSIYAVGDAVEVRQFISGAKTLIPLAGPDNKQG